MESSIEQIGVLAVAASGRSTISLADHNDFLEAVAALAGIAMERLRDAEAAIGPSADRLAEQTRHAFASLLSNEIITAANAIDDLQKVATGANALLPEGWAHLAAELGRDVLRLRNTVAHLRDSR